MVTSVSTQQDRRVPVLGGAPGGTLRHGVFQPRGEVVSR